MDERSIEGEYMEVRDCENENGYEEEEREMERMVRGMERVARAFGLDKAMKAWMLFLCVGVAVPSAALWASHCSFGDCSNIHVAKFELITLLSYCSMAAVSILHFCRYGLRKLLFFDTLRHHLSRFSTALRTQIQGSIKLLKLIIIPCFIVKSIKEVWRMFYIHQDAWLINGAILIGILSSWLYLTTVSLSGCILFNMICNLQIVDVQNYAKLLDGAADVSLFLGEHMRLRHQLSKISHRFRIYLVLILFVVTASQFMTLFETTIYVRGITFLNAGDFLVCSTIQLVGIVLCLRAAAKTTHRAQTIASIVSQWHALATMNPSNIVEPKDNSDGERNSDSVIPISSLFAAEYDSDLELGTPHFSCESQHAAQVVSYHKRQALVMYFQFNQAGITIFGMAVDRALMSTLCFVELSLVLWVLGKTIT